MTTILENLKRCGIIEYKGLHGENNDLPSFIYDGKWYVFDKGTSFKECIISICISNNLIYNQVINPYYGLTYDQKIAEVVQNKLTDIGYTKPLMDGIALNYTLAKLSKLSGEELNDDMLKKIEEGEQLEYLRQQCIKQAYEEFQENTYSYGYSYSYGYDYPVGQDYYTIFDSE